MRYVAITAHRQAEVVETKDDTAPLPSDGVRGRTVVSLCSPGTEVNYAFLAKDGFPKTVGYACVFEVTETGSAVRDLPPGTFVFAPGQHAGHQQFSRADVIPLPAGLAPEKAVFARLAAVSMSTLNTTTARPPARVLVTGLGPVGNLAAQIFSACGYEVTAVDPVPKRREMAQQYGLPDVRAKIGDGPVDLADKVMLHVECSGHEQAVLDGVNTVARRGEVVLIGVPWQRRTDIQAFELLRAIFHRYAVVRSGWEWEVPRQPADFAGNSIIENYAAALRWIASGRLKVDGMAEAYSPAAAQKVYTALADQSLATPTVLFDWLRL